CVRRGYFDVW
nr:immunoglobulin heavy chain junction region [Mus musculus]